MWILLAVLVIGLVAFPAVLPLVDAAVSTEAEQFFFDRQETSVVALALALFAAWNRRFRLATQCASARSGSAPWLSLTLSLLGFGLLFWSRRVGALDLHLASLVVLLLAVATHLGGPSILRVARVPIAISLFILSVPSPLYNEWVWGAQRLATDFSAAGLELLGYRISSGSMLISVEDHDFWVIETCSGLRSMELLTLMAFLITELSARRSRWNVALLVFAPVLAFGMNILRIVAIVIYDHERANASDHVLQGLLAVFIGTGLLMGLQRVLIKEPPGGGPSSDAEALAASSSLNARSGEHLAWLSTLVRRPDWKVMLVFVLATAGSWLPRWPIEHGVQSEIHSFPAARTEWRSERSDSGRAFFNTLPIATTFRRTYESRVPQRRRVDYVDLTIWSKTEGADRLSLRSSKWGWLGPDWEATSRGLEAIWQLGATGRWYESFREDERFLVLVVRLDRRSLIREVADCLLGLARRPGAAQSDELILRFASPIPSNQLEARGVERARKTIYRFLDDFDQDLISLGQRV